ncbi:MAG: asparagine synthase-related protein [Candidatus Saelkia tenebricola]|nr:asparagine synthase-related protein [Candidatus Saelkia tenebricola]
MAGIAGVVSKNTIKEPAIVESMLSILKHRGACCKGAFINDKVCIGSQSIERNVFYNKGRTICLFVDGIIYNSVELKKMIPVQSLYSDCEEAILINLYEKYGVKGFELINGDFVLVIWDSIKKKLVMAKYLSIDKNIYYYLSKDSLIFSSEIKALLIHPEVKKDLDIESINNFLTFRHIPSPYTIFKNIERLNPASAIIYDNNQLQKEKLCYFKIKPIYNKSEDYLLKELFINLEDAVLKRLNKVKEAGLFLSGGLDSSTLLYFLSQNFKDPVKTYTISLLRDGIFAKGVSEYFNSQHIEREVSAKDLISILPKALWHFEYPVNGPDSFLYYLPKISKGQKHIFWGRGAEEVFYGRDDYVALNVIMKFRQVIPRKLWELFSRFSPQVPNKNKLYKFFNIISAKDAYDIYIAFREVLTEIEKKELLNKEIFKFNPKSRLIPYKKFARDILQQYSYLVLVNGFWSDTFLNMGQEVLDPFMDKDFISYCYSIPSELKVRNGQPRYLLKKMMRNKLPEFILKRKKDNWHAQTEFEINKEKDKYYHIINRLRKRGILKFDISNFLQKNKFKSDEKFWALLSLEILLEIFLDQNGAEEPPAIDKF